jgi:hypothetical protein
MENRNSEWLREAEIVSIILSNAPVKGFRSSWDDIIIPGLDFLLVEKTLGKFCSEVEVLTKLPVNLQQFVWK